MLLSAEHLSINFGSRQLLEDVNFYLNEGDKVGVIGINGTGKSTFLKVLAGKLEADAGTISRNPNVQVSLLEQNPPMEDDATVLEQVFLHFPKEFRELKRKFKITAVSDTIDRFSKDCSSCCHPVIFCFFDRISVLVEHIREEVRQQTSFCIFHSFDITDQTKRRTVSYASYNSVNTK